MARSLIRHPALPFACLAWTAGLLLGSLPAAAAETVPAAPYNVSLCVFDFQGAKGDISRYARDLGLQAQRWNITLDIHSYTDERIAAEDFKAGQCDGVVMSTLRARAFNPFIGSIDSIGAAPDYRHIRALAATFDHPKINPLTINGDYQVVTIMPVGASYIMVNNRHIDSIDKALGKKVAVLDFDKPQSLIVQRLGAQAVPTDYYRFANKFNNGEVDIITAPALAVKPLELERGMGDYGGIYRLPLTQVTGALLINRTRLQKTIPDLDARIHTLRRLALPEMDKAIAYIRRQEQAIPAGLWLDFPPAEQEKYVHMMRDTRIRLTREGYYDGRMMALMKKVRCHYDPASYECALNDE